MSNEETSSKENIKVDIGILALFLSLLLGGYVRLAPIISGGFPIHDGGMFTQMVEDVLNARFSLPISTGYNFSQIPFAYPPLGFYLAALVVRISGFGTIQVMQYLPAVINWLSIPVFYLLSKKMLDKPVPVFIATITYTFLPRSWMWMIMGGGLTRSLGVFFGLLSVYYGYRTLNEKNPKLLLPTVVVTGLAFLSHPEAIVFSGLSLFFLFLFYRRDRIGFTHLVLIGVGALIFSIPWWGTVLSRYGVEPFIAAFRTGGHSSTVVLNLIFFNLLGELNTTYFATLAIIGIFFMLGKKQWFLPVWTIAIVLLIPRSGFNFLTIPAAILITLALTEIILPAIANLVDNSRENNISYLKRIYPIFGISLLLYLFINLILIAAMVPYHNETRVTVLSVEERNAMVWIAKNTDIGSQFLVVPMADFWADKSSEWFPYLAQRKSVTTVQGAEWLPGTAFDQALTWAIQTQECLIESSACVTALKIEEKIPFTHIYLPKTASGVTRALQLELMNDPDYTLIYDGEGAAIFAWAGEE